MKKHVHVKVKEPSFTEQQEKLIRVEGIILNTATGAGMMDEVNCFLASLPKHSLLDLQIIPQMLGQMLAVISYEVCA